nr:MAG TPA: hypothetical protein [Caudoviricetes sp.]
MAFFPPPPAVLSFIMYSSVTLKVNPTYPKLLCS